METVPPDQAHYCTEVITGTTFCPGHGTTCRRDECQHRFGTETSYLHLYTEAKPTAAEVTTHVPDGWYKIETRTRRTGH